MVIYSELCESLRVLCGKNIVAKNINHEVHKGLHYGHKKNRNIEYLLHYYLKSKTSY
jgi:hypothetical protein